MVSFKDGLKLIAVMVLTFCAVFISTIFVNFPQDLKEIAHLITDPQAQEIYDAQIVMSKVITACAGGVLGAVTLVVLIFAISRFIHENSPQMGVLKALGYSERRIAAGFSKFGLSIFFSSILAYITAFFFSPLFYKSLSGDAFPVKLTFGFQIETVVYLIIAPTVLFCLLSVLYAALRLKKRPLELINGSKKTKVSKLTKKLQKKESKLPFLKEFKRTVLLGNLVLIFFVAFAAFGFSAQFQMAFTMRELTADNLMSVTLIVIGSILGAVTLLIALTFVINANSKYIAMMKAYGYTENECNNSLFGGYRLVSYIGFAIGTVYQFILVKMIASIFADSYEIPEVTFSFLGFFVSIALFIAAYELIMLLYKRKISRVSLKEIMK